MTRQRSFKRLVRTRMDKTGESYTAARAAILGTSPVGRAASFDEAALPTTDEKIRERTGRGWEEWFDLLDDWGAADRSHREIARWVAEQQGVVPLAWNAQAVVDGYEKARLGKQVGQHEDGFTVNVSAPRRFRWSDSSTQSSTRRRAPAGCPKVWSRSGPPPGRSRPGSTRPARRGSRSRSPPKGDAKASVALAHSRLPHAQAADEMRAWWRSRLDELVADLAGGDDDA